MNACADRRRKNKNSSVRLAILAGVSRVRCAALRDLERQASLRKRKQRKDSIVAEDISGVRKPPVFNVGVSREG
jgi:hypothetical protein